MTTFFMILMKYCVHWTIIRETRFFLSNMPPCFRTDLKRAGSASEEGHSQQIHVVPLFDPALYKKAIPGAYLPPGPSRSSLDLDE